MPGSHMGLKKCPAGNVLSHEVLVQMISFPFRSANVKLLVWVGGLDSWDPLLNGIVTKGYP